MRVSKIQGQKTNPGVNIPWGSKYHMTPGDTFYLFFQILNLIFDTLLLALSAETHPDPTGIYNPG